jgi:hypothetical protein
VARTTSQQFLRCTKRSSSPQSLSLRKYVSATISPLEAKQTDTPKTQSSSSIWYFRYSDFLAHKPGSFGSRIPNFLSSIQEFRCINLSNRDKLLKPANELTTREEKESLLYVLDIFPGLYCQRVTAGDSPPPSTINQPILLVAFASKEAHPHSQQGLSTPVDPDKSNQNRTTSPSRPVSTGRDRGIIDNLKTKFGFRG